MNLFARCTVALALLLALPIWMAAQEGEKPQPEPKTEAKPAADPMALAGKAVGGEWVDEKGVKDPTAPHGRFLCTWGMGNKIVYSKTFWVKDRKATQIYEGASYWHPSRKKVVYFEIPAAGGLYEGETDEKDGVSIARFSDITDKGVVHYEQHGKYLDDDTMESTVYVKKGDELVKSHAFKFHRKPIGWELTKEETK